MYSSLILIGNNIKALATFNYFLSIFIMLSLAWLLNLPEINPGGYNNIGKIIKSYNYIIIFFILLNVILYGTSDLRRELITDRIDLLRSKFSDFQIFLIYFTSYYLFFIIINICPAYLAAVIQGYTNSANNINLEFLAVNCASIATGYGIILIIMAVNMVIKGYSEIKILLISFAFLIITSLINILSTAKFFSPDYLIDIWAQGVNYENVKGPVIWGILFIIALGILKKQSNRFSSGNFMSYLKVPVLFPKILNNLRMYMAKYHLMLLGMDSQKILTFFSSIGLFYLMILMRSDGGNFSVLAKIYLGVFLPVIFSINQRFMICIDVDSGMIQSNLLRKAPYLKILFYRWLLILIPQLSLMSIFFVMLFLNSAGYNLELYFYLILLNIFCSLLTLFLSFCFILSGVANIILIILYYIQLRTDVQSLINASSYLYFLDILKPLIELNYPEPVYYHWITLAFLIAVILVLNRWIINKKIYERNL